MEDAARTFLIRLRSAMAEYSAFLRRYGRRANDAAERAVRLAADVSTQRRAARCTSLTDCRRDGRSRGRPQPYDWQAIGSHAAAATTWRMRSKLRDTERESDLMSSRLLFASVLVLSADAALAWRPARRASRHRVAAAPSMTAEISKDTVDSLEVHIHTLF